MKQENFECRPTHNISKTFPGTDVYIFDVSATVSKTNSLLHVAFVQQFHTDGPCLSILIRASLSIHTESTEWQTPLGHLGRTMYSFENIYSPIQNYPHCLFVFSLFSVNKPRWSGNSKGLSGPLKGDFILEYLSSRFNFTQETFYFSNCRYAENKNKPHYVYTRRLEMVRVTENWLEPLAIRRGLFSYLFDNVGFDSVDSFATPGAPVK